MEGIIKVTPEELISASQQFDGTGSAIRTLTSQMTEVVTSLTSIWEGEVASQYQAKFQGLQDDIERLHSMIHEHVEDLVEMAENFRKAEDDSSSVVESLSSDVII